MLNPQGAQGPHTTDATLRREPDFTRITWRDGSLSRTRLLRTTLGMPRRSWATLSHSRINALGACAERFASEVGDALRIPQSQRDQLDCLQSDDVFVVFVPDGKLGREDFTDLRPLLRQSLVAACAALETYVADKAMEFVGPAVRADNPSRRMKDIPLTVGRWVEIERIYKNRGSAIRSVVEEHIRETSSTAPNRIAEVLSTVGVRDWLKRVDNARRVARSTTDTELKELTERRNHIAHSADRQGRGRASISPEEVARHLWTIKAVVEATELLLSDHSV